MNHFKCATLEILLAYLLIFSNISYYIVILALKSEVFVILCLCVTQGLNVTVQTDYFRNILPVL